MPKLPLVCICTSTRIKWFCQSSEIYTLFTPMYAPVKGSGQSASQSTEKWPIRKPTAEIQHRHLTERAILWHSTVNTNTATDVLKRKQNLSVQTKSEGNRGKPNGFAVQVIRARSMLDACTDARLPTWYFKFHQFQLHNAVRSGNIKKWETVTEIPS